MQSEGSLRQHAHQDRHGCQEFFFTELELISELLNRQLIIELQMCGAQISLGGVSEEGDVKVFLVHFGQNNQMGQLAQSLSVRITMLQIQTSIKFHIIYSHRVFHSPTISQKKEQILESCGLDTSSGAHSSALKSSFEYVDEFWINYRNYLPKRLYQCYHYSELGSKQNRPRSSKLQLIFSQRISKQIISQICAITGLTGASPEQAEGGDRVKKSASQQNMSTFINAIAQNYLALSKFISPKDYRNLQLSSRELFKILHTQANYKMIFEHKWGRTGFDLQQKNWINMYKNKVMERSRKSNTSSSQSFPIFLW